MRQISDALNEYKNKLAGEREEQRKKTRLGQQIREEVRTKASEALRKLFTETFQIDLSPIKFELEERAISYNNEQSSREYELTLVYPFSPDSSIDAQRRCTCAATFIYVIATGEVYPHYTHLQGNTRPSLAALVWFTGGSRVGVQLNEFIRVLQYLVEGLSAAVD